MTTEPTPQNDSPGADQGLEQPITYDSLDAFYAARGGAFSGEADYGSWWLDEAQPLRGPRYRVSVVHDTGDVYAINFWSQTIELLATLTPHECRPNGLKHAATCAYTRADQLLDGWAAETASKPLSWVRERLQAVEA